MNCKQGDLAYVTHPKYFGWFVTVLHREPDGNYLLPDGYFGQNRVPNCWIVESLGSAFDAPLGGGGFRKTIYAAIQDKWLRPIRPSEGQDETLSWKDVPQGEYA